MKIFVAGGSGRVATDLIKNLVAATPEEIAELMGDVATVLADLLKYDNTGKKVIMMQNGDTPIAEALAEI